MLWIVENGETWYVEVKADLHARLTDSEFAFEGGIVHAGALYMVVRSVDDVERLLRR